MPDIDPKKQRKHIFAFDQHSVDRLRLKETPIDAIMNIINEGLNKEESIKHRIHRIQ